MPLRMLAAALLLSLAGCQPAISPPPQVTPPVAPPTPRLAIGDEAILMDDRENKMEVPAYRDGDLTPLPIGTRVQVLAIDSRYVRVKILDGPDAGRAAKVLPDTLKSAR